ncbi:MAG TPA: hypothetical protein VM367_09610 [Pseudonocardia sp.]|nr:hypothetical protein [Pseudonocardia sp.]
MIADSVRHYRKRRSMSAQDVANACSGLGYASLTRGVIANLETGARDSITVGEWLILAAALQVPPLLLLFPVGRRAEVEVLPDTTVSPWAALNWTEHGRLTGVEEPFAEDAITIAEFRRHDEFVSMWAQARQEGMRVRELLAKDPADLKRLDEDVNELRLELADRERLEERASIMLGQVRRTLRRAGLTPPDLPRALRFVDEDTRP